MLHRWQTDDMDHKYMKKHSKYNKHYDWGEANQQYNKSRQTVFETAEKKVEDSLVGRCEKNEIPVI